MNDAGGHWFKSMSIHNSVLTLMESAEPLTVSAAGDEAAVCLAAWLPFALAHGLVPGKPDARFNME